MPDTVQALTSRLLTAIDSEGNVTDMSIVLNLVSVLEKTNVTAEDLKVTRLGKFINLIRRKIADVDRQLSKRLKKLVKQWQLLLQSKAPNGIIPPPTVTSASSVQPVSSPLNSLDSGYGSQTTHITSPPTDSSYSFLSASQVDESTSYLKTTLNNSSGSAMDASTFSRTNSRESPSYCTPTPSPTPPTSHSSPLVSTSTSKKRLKMIQKLSSVKSTSVSPNKTSSEDGVAQSNPSSSSKYLSLPSSETLHANSHSSVLVKNQTAQSHDHSPCRGSNLVSEALETKTQGETTYKPWTSDSFTKVSATHDTMNGAHLVAVFDRDDSNVCNNLDISYCQNSRKRDRAGSPEEKSSMDLMQPHKRHKVDKGSSRRDKTETKQLIVRVPLVKICINSHKKLREEQVCHDEVDARVAMAMERSELIVSFPISKLKKIPVFCGGGVSTHSDHDTPFSTSHHPPQSHFPSHHPPQSHPPGHHHITHGLCEKNDHLTQSDFQANFRHLDENSLDQNVCPHAGLHTPTHQKPFIPEGACPGVCGCVGIDGHWYDWTDPICSHGGEVTILPYVYIED